tara:strand:+ start:793 stop:987 length:195 start_codon:yes stop_codon:yes gene_type:complete
MWKKIAAEMPVINIDATNAYLIFAFMWLCCVGFFHSFAKMFIENSGLEEINVPLGSHSHETALD